MATTVQTSNAADTVEQFSTDAYVDQYKATAFGTLARIGAITEAPELTGSRKGDQLTISLVNILTGLGIGEGGTMTGNEEALDKETFTMTTGIMRHAVLNPNGTGTIEAQRTNLDFEGVSKELLTGFHGSRQDAAVFNVGAGCTATTITVDGAAYTTAAKRLFVQGFNTPTAPTSSRILRAAAAATDQALTSSDTMALDLVDDALVDMQDVYPNLKPLPNGRYAMFMSYGQRLAMERDSAGQIQYYQIQLARTQGGMTSGLTEKDGLPAESMPWGYYKNVDFYCSNRIASGQNSSTAAAITTVKRAVIFGRNSMVYGSPNGTLKGGNVPLRLYVQMQDYDYYKGREGRMLYGLKKPVQNSQDLGTFVISTYSA